LTNKGAIAPGFDADLVIWDDAMTVITTIHQGQVSYSKEDMQ